MKRLVGVIFTAVLLLLSLGGQTVALAKGSHSRRAAPTAGLVRVRPGVVVNTGMRQGAIVPAGPRIGVTASNRTATPIPLQLPWPTGQSHDINGGNSYNCNDHVGLDYYAIDFALPSGSDVSAVAAGIVHEVDYPGGGGYGHFIWIDHGGGIVSLYGHLSKWLVPDGAHVAQGQLIALSGNTGNSTGPHLHFSLRSGATSWNNGSALEPEPMSGYTGFGAYGACTGVVSPEYTSEPPATQLSVTSVFPRNSNGVNQTLFKQAAGIQYAFEANNSGNDVTASVQIEVFWLDVNDGATQIFDTTFQNVDFPPGTTGYEVPTSIPKDAVPGPYTMAVTICYNDSSGNLTCVQGISQKGQPTVTGIDRLAGCKDPDMNLSTGWLQTICAGGAGSVPYWDQYAVYRTNSEDCGPASVAMTLNYYGQGPAWARTWAGGRTAGLTTVRNATGAPGDVPTNTAQLENAITTLGGSYQEIVPNPSLPDAAIETIGGAIRARQPVIAFIDASVLGRPYSGHWLVVLGFYTNSKGTSYAILYDPDYNPVGGAYPEGYIKVLLATFNKAIISGANLGGDSIVVTG